MEKHDFLFENHFDENDFTIVLKNNRPIFQNKIIFVKTTADFNLGEFRFFIKGKNGKIFQIAFHNNFYTINDFWIFLEKLTMTEKALLFTSFYKGEEIFIYAEPIKKNDLRFTVTNTINLRKKEKEEKILKYSIRESETDIDVIIPKKKFIRQFYSKLKTIFEEYTTTALFEPPLIDFNFWIKDSDILKDYLKTKST